MANALTLHINIYVDTTYLEVKVQNTNIEQITETKRLKRFRQFLQDTSGLQASRSRLIRASGSVHLSERNVAGAIEDEQARKSI